MAVETDVKTIADAGFDQYLKSSHYGMQQMPNGVSSRFVGLQNLNGGNLGNIVIKIGKITIDGVHDRITVNDGINDRVVIGKLSF